MPRVFQPPELNPDDFETPEDMVLAELNDYSRHVRTDRFRRAAGLPDEDECAACADGPCPAHASQEDLGKIAALSLDSEPEQLPEE